MAAEMDLGALFRRLRTERGEPLRVVAAAAAMDSTLLSRIERGERLPTAAQVDALATHFDIPSEELFATRNAVRMLRHLSSAEEVLRAAEIIERHSGASRLRPDASDVDRDTHDSGRTAAQPRVAAAPRRPLFGPAAVSPHPAAAGASPVSHAEPVRPLEGTRSDRLGEIEEAAAAGAAAIYRLAGATSDPDRVVALRAQELLQQLRTRLG